MVASRNGMFDDNVQSVSVKKPKRTAKKKVDPRVAERDKLYASFTKKQKLAFDLAMEGENLFLSGSGGTGKSFLLNGIVKTMRNLYNKQVIVCAPTGVAANNINGVTIHHQFGFPIGPCLKETRKGSGKYVPYAKADAVLKLVDCVIIDEISMVSISMFDSIFFSLEKANKFREANGLKKIQVLVHGDFYQLDSVITEDCRLIMEKYYNGYDTCVNGELGNGYAFNSVNWAKLNLKNIILDEVVRQKNPELVYHLNKLREGKKGFTNYFNHNCRTEPMEDGVNLYPYNAQVREANKKKLDEMDGIEYRFEAQTRGNISPEDCNGNYELFCKIGAKVMFTINDNPRGKNNVVKNRAEAYENKQLFVNGTMGTIRDIYIDETDHDNDHLTIEIEGSGDIVKILRKEYEVQKYVVDDDGKINLFTFGSYKQMPVILSFSMTIHKSQGCTFPKVNVFPGTCSPGQLYVALSRATDVEHLYLETYIREEYLLTNNEVREFYKNLKVEEPLT